MFDLTKEQADIRKAAREFAEGEFTDIARELDEKGCFDDRLWKKAAELGFLAVFIPEKYQGLGMGYLEQCLIVEEFARVDLFFDDIEVALLARRQQHVEFPRRRRGVELPAGADPVELLGGFHDFVGGHDIPP